MKVNDAKTKSTKKAVIIVGAQNTGKTLTLFYHLKPRLKIGSSMRKFILKGKNGIVVAKTLEESGADVSALGKCLHYDLFVLAARPKDEPGSKLAVIKDALEKASFKVFEVKIKNKDEAPERAREIYRLLR